MSAQESVVGVSGSQRKPEAGARAARAAGPRLEHEVPPCASAICRLSTSPMPVPFALVVKNGTNRLPGSGRPGPVVVHGHLGHAAQDAPADGDAAPGLERGVGRVPHQVDQELVELVAVGGERDRRPAAPPSPRAAAPARPPGAPTRRSAPAPAWGCGSRASCA